MAVFNARISKKEAKGVLKPRSTWNVDMGYKQPLERIAEGWQLTSAEATERGKKIGQKKKKFKKEYQ